MTQTFRDSPEEQAARRFMAHKGYGFAEPYEVAKLEGQPCWYFSYRLPEGILELEVSWTDEQEWDARVSVFKRD